MLTHDERDFLDADTDYVSSTERDMKDFISSESEKNSDSVESVSEDRPRVRHRVGGRKPTLAADFKGGGDGVSSFFQTDEKKLQIYRCATRNPPM